LSQAEAQRSYASTALNHASSRSHAVVRIQVETRFANALQTAQSASRRRLSQEPTEDGASGEGGRFRTSVANFVDLAGSERAKRSNATGKVLREASQINRSLMQLGLVISRLAFLAESKAESKESRGHIPYRNSKLTHLLMDALGGRSMAAMITTIRCVRVFGEGDKLAATLHSHAAGTCGHYWNDVRVSHLTPLFCPLRSPIHSPTNHPALPRQTARRRQTA